MYLYVGMCVQGGLREFSEGEGLYNLLFDKK